tara:strand:- start:522 stop:872 length:351 start_codon:yes stop_codon:yes gene_type:complete
MAQSKIKTSIDVFSQADLDLLSDAVINKSNLNDFEDMHKDYKKDIITLFKAKNIPIHTIKYKNNYWIISLTSRNFPSFSLNDFLEKYESQLDKKTMKMINEFRKSKTSEVFTIRKI